MITDPVILIFEPEYEAPWALVRGRETFFNDEDQQLRWADPHRAVAWANENLSADPVINQELVEQLEGLYGAVDDRDEALRLMENQIRTLKKEISERPVQVKMWDS